MRLKSMLEGEHNVFVLYSHCCDLCNLSFRCTILQLTKSVGVQISVYLILCMWHLLCTLLTIVMCSVLVVTLKNLVLLGMNIWLSAQC